MLRFTIKSLLFITAVVATYGAAWNAAINRSTWSLLVTLVALACLVGGRVYYDMRSDRTMMNNRSEGARPPD